LKEIVKKGIETKKFEITPPSLESIFLAVVEAEEWIKY
jgi:hypothetical protein